MDAPKAWITCILCERLLTSTREDPQNGDRHEVLVCGAHTDEELSRRGLDVLWAGGDTRPGVVHEGPDVRLAGAWALGAGAFGIYLLFDDGDLLMLTPEHNAVASARVTRALRARERPVGVPEHDVRPWRLAVAEGTRITSIRRLEDGHVELCLAGRGTVKLSVYLASWRELGDGRYFLAEDWSPRY
jgi:hypothetical protein